MSKILQELKKLIKEFETFQAKYAKQGAQDTEPDGVFQVCLVRAFKGKDVKVPDTPEGWELYSETRGAKDAAFTLSAAAWACVNFIRGIPICEAEPVQKYLEDYCWRVSW